MALRFLRRRTSPQQQLQQRPKRLSSSLLQQLFEPSPHPYSFYYSLEGFPPSPLSEPYYALSRKIAEEKYGNPAWNVRKQISSIVKSSLGHRYGLPLKNNVVIIPDKLNLRCRKEPHTPLTEAEEAAGLQKLSCSLSAPIVVYDLEDDDVRFIGSGTVTLLCYREPGPGDPKEKTFCIVENAQGFVEPV
ncbi:MAG: hypothetical protein QXL98_03310 [Thermofilaceae archaeon]